MRIALSATDCWARGATISRAPTTAASPGRPGSVARWLPYLSGAAQAAVVASQRGRGREGEREKEAEVDLDGCHAGRREGGSARAPCAATVSSAPLVGPSIRREASCAALPFLTEDEDDECDHGGGVCWLSRPHLPRKPPNSTDKVSPHSPAPPLPPSADRPAAIASFLSFLPSFQTRRGHRRRRWRGTAFASRRQVALHSHPLITVPARSGMAALG